MTEHTPLHELEPGEVATAGRLHLRDGVWHLTNARSQVALAEVSPRISNGSLCRIEGHFDGESIVPATVECMHAPQVSAPKVARRRGSPLAEALALRERGARKTRAFFESRGFTHVETPHRVEEPGTDVYLEPLRVERGDTPPSYLHTSPEFAMKELLSVGFERIWQLARVWRGGERTRLHHPEFTIVEWYRAWEGVEAIMDDVEALTRAIVGEVAQIAAEDASTRRVALEAPFERMTMREVVRQSCGFDILDAHDHASLLSAAREASLLTERGLARAREHGRWEELFFDLQVTHIDPFLAERGAVFVTEWPAPLAVLARRKPSDPRVAERFELYVGGIEIANGFRELTDPHEQRQRFEQDNRARRELGSPELPMPERFLEALEFGLPPSSGVAVGFDRVLMLASGAAHIRDVLPYAQK